MYLARAKVGSRIVFGSIGFMFFYIVYLTLHRPFPDAWITNSVVAICAICFGVGMFILLRSLHAQDRADGKAAIEKILLP